MSEQTHRGGRLSGPFTQTADRRISELDEALRRAEGASDYQPELARDSTRSAQTRLQKLNKTSRIVRGTVIHAIPTINWYKVQLSDGMGTVPARMLASSGLTPIGPRDLAMARPNDDVLVMTVPGTAAIIIGVLPSAVADPRLVCPDWIVQGGGSGLLREEAHKFPIKGAYQGSGIVNWGANRPIDQTGLERGWITPAGLAMLIDDWHVQVRVNEMCGLYMTLADSYLRLAGVQLRIESSVHEETAGDDEGEARYFRGIATYPWEANGSSNSGTPLSKENDDKEVEFSSHEGKKDLIAADTQPAYRYVEYGGYLGQGHMRAVLKPAETERRVYRDTTPDVGLFRENIGLDGGYTLLSAKSVHIGKRCMIVVPKEISPPEHGLGDDSRDGDYKFSSKFGTGDEHKVGEVRVDGEQRSLRKVAGVMDLIAYAVNWQAVHPFHYHGGDFSTPQESDLSPFTRTQERLDFAALASGGLMADPTPIKVRIDHRYGEVSYFQRESFLRFEDDGTVHMGCGFGGGFVFSNGNARLSVPGRIELVSGTDTVVIADQFAVATKGSIDLASDRDVRLKSERNMQMLAGNSGSGGMLLESKGKGSSQQYDNKFGEDVQGSGVVIKASQGVAALLGKDVYLRTGGDGLGEGDILLDASRGKRRCQIFGREFNVYAQKAVSFFYGPTESSSDVDKVYYFGETAAIFDVSLLLKNKLINYGDQAGIITKGGVYGLKSFATAGVMADKKGMFLGKVPDSFAGTISTAADQANTSVDKLKESGETLHQVSIVQKYYQTGQMGDDKLIESLAFSFRDPPSGRNQYGASQLKWVEARWQQMARFGLASGGGTAWSPKPVLYQGNQTMPFPGKKIWKDEDNFLRLASETMFDSGVGRAKDRPAPYEDPALADWESVTMADGLLLTR